MPNSACACGRYAAFAWASEEVLCWERRREMLRAELVGCGADVICLQVGTAYTNCRSMLRLRHVLGRDGRLQSGGRGASVGGWRCIRLVQGMLGVGDGFGLALRV